MLTPEQIDILNAPFDDVRDYGVVNGKVYLRKEAIKRRLTAADPGWSISEPQFVARDGDVVFMSATLTVGGVSRAALGSGTINSTRKVKRKDANGKEIEIVVAVEGYDLALEIRKAYKGAAMDCLARAAVFFMRGLDDLREKPNNEQSLAIINGFLKQRRPSTPQDSTGSQPPARQPQPPQDRRMVNNPLSETARKTQRPAGEWQEVVKIKMVKGAAPDLPMYKLNLANGKTALVDNPNRLESAGFSLMSIEKLDVVYDVGKGLYITVKNSGGNPMVDGVWVEPRAA